MFFILGMPRSRTFWLSQFLGCVHEGLWYYPNYEDFLKTKHIGDSTTCYPAIKDYIKDQKKVIIHRDPEEVQASIRKLFNVEIDLSIFDTLKDEQGLHVQYRDINDRLREIWEYTRTSPFPTKRAELMKDQILNNTYLIKEVQSCL